MLHEPASPGGKDPAAPYKMRLGIRMFTLYALFYVSFVAINLLSPLTMASIIVAGLNLATVYGFGLIVIALLEALIYHALCRRKEAELSPADDMQSADAQDREPRR